MYYYVNMATQPTALGPDAQQVLREINSWWKPGSTVRPVPPTYERPLVDRLLKAVSHPGARIQVLRGPRQVGKSTAILHLVRRLIRGGTPPTDILLIRFDLDLLRETGNMLKILRWYTDEIRHSPLGQGRPCYLLLDEIHKLDRWDEQVKHVFDTYRPRVVMTGSSSVLVARGQRESLAGRALTSELPPFLFREVLEMAGHQGMRYLPNRLDMSAILGRPDLVRETFRRIRAQPAQRRLSWDRALERYYNRGGYPDLHTGAVEEDRWADFLIETVFERVLGVDIPDLFPVDQPRLLRHIYMEVARRTGQEIAQKRLADEAATAGYPTNQPTVGRYLHYLSDALLIREFRRFPLARKASARLPAKFTLTDLGVRNALFRGAPSLRESAPEVVGPLVETLVQSVLGGPGIQVHFYRQPRDPARPRGGMEEVDFVVEAPDGTVVPIEVKYRRRIDREDWAPVEQFIKRYNSPLGLIVTRETYSDPPDSKIILVPLRDFLLAF